MWPDALKQLDTTFESLAENLEFDVALLRAVQSDPASATLRFWESAQYAVIVGRSNDIDREVDGAACQCDDVPILRRPSGGGAVVLGPGCLCFSLALPIPARQADIGISGVTRAVMQQLATSLTTPEEEIVVRGISDLVLRDRQFPRRVRCADHDPLQVSLADQAQHGPHSGPYERKFSGNAQRWLRNAFLHHGTILYDFDLDRITRYLKLPSRQPDYRQGRPHAEFVTNLARSRESLVRSLSDGWNAFVVTSDRHK